MPNSPLLISLAVRSLIPAANLPDVIRSLRYYFHEFPKIGAINCEVKLQTHPASFLQTSQVLSAFKLVSSSPVWCTCIELVWTFKTLRNSVYLVECHMSMKAVPIFFSLFSRDQGTSLWRKIVDKIIFQAEEMTQSWKCMFCEYENLSSATQVPCQSQVWYYHPFNLSAWGKRQEDPWGLMAS